MCIRNMRSFPPNQDQLKEIPDEKSKRMLDGAF